MKVRSGQLGQAFQLAQRAIQTQTPKAAVPASREAGIPIASRTAQATTSVPPRTTQLQKAQVSTTGGGETNGTSTFASRAVKYVALAAGAGYIYDKTANDFFLSTTALHDGKGGFTSNERLNKAQGKAKEYFQHYHGNDLESAPAWPASAAEYFQEQKLERFSPISTCGNNQFVTMTDYRAATKVHVENLMNTKEARESLLKNLTCLKGHLVKEELVAKHNPPHVPENFDLTKSHLYEEKNKYALVGIPNEETGARGYTSRSITQPFVNKGYKHFKNESEARGQSLKQCVESLEALLQTDDKFGEEAQLAAGRAILNFRQVYANDEHWGHAEKVVMKTLTDHGLLSPDETHKIDESLMFEDPSKSIFKRNTGVLGPMLHKIETGFHEFRLRNDPQALEDMKPMFGKNVENMAIAHFKVNEKGNGFEDCSGLGDSFTSANAIAVINHARLMSGEDRLSKEDVGVIVACLNAVYDDVSGIRHTLHEVARGCFAGAGYTIEDADRFYANVCKKAADEFYGGKNLAKLG